MSLVIPLSNSLLDAYEMKNREYLVCQELYDLPSGQQEYRLYSYLSGFFNNTTILDIGTAHGRSAIALSDNTTNTVLTYDLTDSINQPDHPIYTKSNIQFKFGNILDELTMELVSNLSIVVIDIDQCGGAENEIIDKLKSFYFSGLVILDDTTNHPEPNLQGYMLGFWNGIVDTKLDLTPYGHFSGTGVVILNPNISFELN
jgi:hypothetical protein